MKDNFGNTKPIKIEENEWWFNGRIIVKQKDSLLRIFFPYLKSLLNNILFNVQGKTLLVKHYYKATKNSRN